MKYELNVTDKSGNLIDIVKGDDIDEVLRRAAKLTTKEFLGYYYEKERIIMNSCNELARTLTEGIKKRLNDEIKIFDLMTYKLSEITWELLLNNFYENNPQPVKESPPVIPALEKIPPQPNMNDSYYQYKFNLKDEILPFKKKQTVERLRLEFQRHYLVWEKKKESIEARNNEKIKEHEVKLRLFEDDFAKQLGDWIEKKSEIADRTRTFKEGYKNFKSFAVEKYCELILLHSAISNFQYKRKISLNFVEETKFLFIEFLMPSKNELSNIKEIAYSNESGKFEEVRFSDSEMNERYQSILFQIVFKSLYELFQLDKINALNEITFRGTILPDGEGSDTKHSIPVLSLTIVKSDFLNINFGEGIKLAEFFNLHGGIYNTDFGKNSQSLIPMENSGNPFRSN